MQKMYHKDHILVTVENWEKASFRLEREPASERKPVLIRERDRLLADIFYGLLEKSVNEVIYQYIAVPTAYALFPDKGGYPPNHWVTVVEEDERMEYNGFGIGYTEGRMSLFERMVKEASGERLSAAPKKFSKEQGQQVYRFKAELAYNPKIWRKIEIQGKQSLADFDRALRDAFNHDQMDHLGGFWKLVHRGGPKSKRYREIDLGDVDPFGGGEGASTQVAGIGLQVGDRLKYVYDFGEWIEHTLTLEAIQAQQQGAKYPREVERNEPTYVACVECQKQGKETVAIWICLTCTYEKGQDVVLCERHAGEHEEEEHYTEEILY